MTQNKPVRIALTGRMRSGKTTVANILSVEYGFHELAFGDALKRHADELFEGSSVYPDEYVDISEVRGHEVDPFRIKRKNRRLYQDFGQAIRQLDADVWIRQVEQSLAVLENFVSIKRFVISDLRQPNEYKWARANGFII